MLWRRLLATVTAVILSAGFTACGLSAGGLAPDTPDAGDPTGGGGAGGGQGGAGSVVGSSGSSGSSSSSSGGGEDCSGANVACEKVPAEWKVAFVKDADPLQPPGKCADGSTGTLYFTGPAGLPSCSACTCGVDPAATCNAPEISCWYDQNDCSGKEDAKAQLATNNACANLPGVPGGITNPVGSCKITKPAAVLNAGTCSFQGGTNTTPSPWTGAKLVCLSGAAEGGCMTGQRCVPTAPAPDGASCVIRPGTDACPPTFPNPSDTFSGVGNDSRSCGTCGCTVGCTGGSYRVHDSNDCGGFDPDDITVSSTGCTPTPNLYDENKASVRATVGQPGVATCVSGKAVGKVDGTGQQRICCR